MTKRWKTPDIIALLSDPSWTITNNGPGGDVDSDTLVIVPTGADHKLFVVGFDPDSDDDPVDPSDCEIAMIALEDGEDSQGGLNTTCRITGHAYVEIRARLIEAGFSVVPSLGAWY